MIKDDEELHQAEKQVKEEYLKEIRQALSVFPCFLGKDLLIYSRKIWNDLTVTEFPSYHKDIVFDALIESVSRSIKFQSKSENPFLVYRYILKVARGKLDTKKGQIDEGDSI